MMPWLVVLVLFVGVILGFCAGSIGAASAVEHARAAATKNAVTAIESAKASACFTCFQVGMQAGQETACMLEQADQTRARN